MQRKINDGENPKILATQSTKNKTETNSSKKQTPTTGMYTDTLKGYEVTRHETNIDKPCRTPLYEIIQEQQQSGSDTKDPFMFQSHFDKFVFNKKN
jgi:hypothetical protein